jgi:hypothetical protein
MVIDTWLQQTQVTQGFWTIYDVIAGPLVGSKELRLIRVQNYDTSRYWSYINWYTPGYTTAQ